jgi:hypothetical protein
VIHKSIKVQNPIQKKLVRGQNALLANPLIRFDRKTLTKLKAKALRRRLWYSILTRERLHIELTMRVVSEVRSPFLTRIIWSIVKKLLDAMQSKVFTAMKKFGLKAAEKLGRLAYSWGHKSAINWMMDLNFAKYLAIMRMNMQCC